MPLPSVVVAQAWTPWGGVSKARMNEVVQEVGLYINTKRSGKARKESKVKQGEMRIMCSSGDDTIFWDPQDQKSIDNAKAKFDKYVKKGYKVFRLDEKDKKSGRALTEFPTFAAKLLFVPVFQGG